LRLGSGYAVPFEPEVNISNVKIVYTLPFSYIYIPYMNFEKIILTKTNLLNHLKPIQHSILELY
jgi:hypothetical protein